MFFRNKGGIHRLKRVRWYYRKFFLVWSGEFGIGTGGLIVATNFAPVKPDTINPSIYPAIHPSIAPTNNENKILNPIWCWYAHVMSMHGHESVAKHCLGWSNACPFWGHILNSVLFTKSKFPHIHICTMKRMSFPLHSTYMVVAWILLLVFNKKI